MKSSLSIALCCLTVACSDADGPTQDMGPITADGSDGLDAGVTPPGDGMEGDGADGSDAAVPPADELVEGCSGQTLRAGIPDDLSLSGPWPVGAVTVELGGLPTEIWYPARPGSEAEQAPHRYDIREHLPEASRANLPEEHNPLQPCRCYRDLPLDDAAGPYPVIQFIHGTAGFRTTNLDNATHWASRGFVVVASDHPGIRLRDMLDSPLGGGANQAEDARKVLAALLAAEGDAQFLSGHLDGAHVGLIGHSAGGGAVASMADLADVIVVYAAGGSVAPSRASSMLQLVGADDGVAGGTARGYDASTTPTRRFASIAKGGHLVGGNLCTIRDPLDPASDIVDLARTYMLANPLVLGFAGQLFDGCNELPDDTEPFIAAARGITIMNHVTAGVFEEALHCADTASRLADLPATFGSDIADYAETLP